MTFLLDANVLIALCDELHAHHVETNGWFMQIGRQSWATCPLTENAFVRITSGRTYPRSTGSVAEQLKVLRELCALPGHCFWADDLSLLRKEVWLDENQVRPNNLTDLYLLALAVKNEGKFISLDRAIPAYRIRKGAESLQVLSTRNQS